ncbi:NADH:ubiquinone oxidoreductase kDa subunit [Zopfochytrium polystomum]|nr:NADH:ubiquinone oxidoreductase kDa subunit [Zopfochytrium polystomum]
MMLRSTSSAVSRASRGAIIGSRRRLLSTQSADVAAATAAAAAAATATAASTASTTTTASGLPTLPSALPQAPNHPAAWSKHQQLRKDAMTGPRFEQTNFDFQPNPPAAIEFINALPPTLVKGRKVACDGGGGALGHPKVYINLDEGSPIACGYCGLKYQKDPHHHH